jgi:hypothetical protein
MLLHVADVDRFVLRQQMQIACLHACVLAQMQQHNSQDVAQDGEGNLVPFTACHPA